MTAKTSRYFWIVLLALTACGTTSPATEMPKVQNTTVAIVQTGVALTQTALPTTTPTALPTLTPEATATPTQPIVPLLTPDAIQVERWKEYQAELAKAVLSSNPELGNNPAVYKDALCEWDILGQSGQEVYVYAVCVIAKGNGDMRKPVIVYLDPDGSIQNLKLPEVKKANSEMFDYGPFPIDVQEKFCSYFDPFPSDLPPCPYSSTHPRPRLDLLYTHIEYRKTHSEEPPLVVLSVMPTATPAATPIPTQPIAPIITPDAIQVERWKEYQIELAKVLLYGYGSDAYKDALCEWDILGLSDQEVYVWAYCATLGGGNGRLPAVIHLEASGTVQSVEVPEINNSTWDSQIRRMFPEDMRNKFDFYTGKSLFVGRVKEMMNHIDYRQTHPEEPPLVVLSAMPIATPMP